ncbi:glycosyltransferase [Actinoplanes sp. NPDC049548]|uniref:glycosyltransferase n=1 Tax=Actinoplanes sp. NPDC049548 TaxID=3155152 RepID=UPI00341E5050
MSRVVVWRSGLLAPSETFVRAQAHALTRWHARFLGAVKVPSPLAEESDVIVFPERPAKPRRSAGGRDALGSQQPDRQASRGSDAGFLRLRLSGRSPHLRRVLASLDPDVVHAHFGGDGWLISRAAADLGVPLIVTLHGHDVTRQPYAKGMKGVRYRRNLRSVFRRAAIILAVSEHIRRLAIARGADPSKVRVHHTGVPIPPLPQVEKRWDVVFVGRFVPKKGLDDLVEAVAMLPDLAPRVLLVGDGPLMAPLRARVAHLGVDVTFAGALNHAAAQECMAAAKVFASPSRTAPDGDSEGLPTTLLEAAARGVPVISTVHSGIPEAVIQGTTGLLSAEGDRAALASHLRTLLTDNDLRERLGRQARAHVRAHFDLKNQTRRLENIYDEVTEAAAAITAPAADHETAPAATPQVTHDAAAIVAPRVPRPRTPAPPELGPFR